ncbi:cobalamin biosynthesis protein CobW [Actinomyces viscosus]|uniref:Cobalamin synthesis protein cobW C-terminal domain n=1 Tax=Actinomyces viscosus TaxID=1656 RepID=A0A3S4X7E0_ACTVI|nr:GTP-binding protein [Actinomyces viscosus]TFH53655.1 cobalamin biosynthesis protein CobW [Actinomyces viscosus]VEI14304.1 Cobalamin synthesis protein cobW C-terminal domain [Actinomyces viscosus]
MIDPSDDLAADLFDRPDDQTEADHRHALAVIGAVDPALLDLVDLSLAGQGAVVIRAGLHFGDDGDEDDGNDGGDDGGDDDFVRLVSHSSADGFDDDPVRLDVPMPLTCPTCSLREVLVAVAEDRAAQDPGGTTVILLPAAIELAHLLPHLAEDLTGTEVRLAGAAHVLDATTACDELLEHRLLTAFPGDCRCAGAVHLANLGYADVVLALGRDEDPAGADLIEHLRPHDALLLPGLDAPLLEALTGLTHDVRASLSRIHPATTSAWGGPDDHGVWTLDLSAALPFHPGRLRALVVDLAGQGLCARGCFWLPSRPGRVCTWEVVGGALSVGDAGTWAEVPTGPSGDVVGVGGGIDGGASGEPRCHLVVTGVGDEDMREQVRRAFARILLRPEEMAQALAWIGADDGLSDWFGQGSPES